MDNNEKQNLDTYRQERKERIAKQNKSAAKKSNSHSGAKAALSKVVSAVIAVVVVIAIVGASLNFFGVPQRLIKAVTIDGESYSMSELSCYYMQIYNNYANSSYSYDSNYGEGYGKMLTGYDYNLSPSEQTTTDHDGNTVTWDEFFLEEAIENMASIKRYYKAALEAGITLTEDDEAEIQETLDSIQTQIDSYKSSSTNPQAGNYSVSRYLTLTYGKGVTERFFKKVLTEQKTVEVYQESRQDEIGKAYSADAVEAVYAEAPTDYDVVDFRWYTISVETSEETADTEASSEDTAAALTAAQQQAQSFIDKVKSEANYSEETFKNVVLETVGTDDENYETYKQEAATLLQKADMETLKSNVSEDAANWLFETNDSGAYVRQAGDMKYFVNSDSDTVYIFYATGTPYRDETKHASVRHILVQFPDETTEETSSEAVSGEAETVAEEDTTVSAEVKSECYSEAESILADYESYIAENFSGKADEDYFGELASNLSDDTGSASDGGLIEDLANDGTYVKEFEDWVFAEGNFAGAERAAGTTEIIETEYGYHIMYFVSQDENAEWYQTILDDLVAEDWEAEQTEFEESFAEDAIVRKEKVEGWVKDACLDLIG